MISDENLEGYDRVGEIYYNPNVPLGTGAAGTVVCRGYFHKRYVAVKKYQRTLMSEMDNLHPIRPNLIAIILPIPEPAPVRKTCSPFRSFLPRVSPYSLLNDKSILKNMIEPIHNLFFFTQFFAVKMNLRRLITNLLNLTSKDAFCTELADPITLIVLSTICCMGCYDTC